MITQTKQVYSVPLSQIKSYLKLNHWSLKNENDHWLVFAGDHFIDIVLAKDTLAPDYHVYVDHMLKTLSSATGKVAETIANDIVRFDRDFLKIRVDETPIDYSAKQSPRIKSLIRHSANSEQNIKPHFDTSFSSKAAKKMIEHFQLTQSINGTSSFQVESRVGEKEAFQRSLPLDNRPDPGDKLPLERRVMERIAAGLVTLDQAARKQSAKLLIDGYSDGLNANMCDAILTMSKYSQAPIVYDVIWSKKIDASEGVKVVKNIEVDHRHRTYLKEASEKLKELKPEFQSIRGIVIGLSSLVAPQSDKVDGRSIVVLWDRRMGSPRKLKVNLSKEDYLDAIKAHEDWATISVEGIAEKRRSGWELADPQEFKIVH